MSSISVLGQNLDSIFNTLKFRNIGPFRGGRSNSGSGVNGDPLTYYMTTTGGGVWKTTDAGQHWRNISDGFFKSGSVKLSFLSFIKLMIRTPSNKCAIKIGVLKSSFIAL